MPRPDNGAQQGWLGHNIVALLGMQAPISVFAPCSSNFSCRHLCGLHLGRSLERFRASLIENPRPSAFSQPWGFFKVRVMQSSLPSLVFEKIKPGQFTFFMSIVIDARATGSWGWAKWLEVINEGSKELTCRTRVHPVGPSPECNVGA